MRQTYLRGWICDGNLKSSEELDKNNGFLFNWCRKWSKCESNYGEGKLVNIGI